MAEAATKLPVQGEAKETRPAREWRPLESLQRAIDRLFDDFDRGLPSLRERWGDGEPFRGLAWGMAPAADVSETEGGFEVSMELPGLTEKDVDVTVANRALTVSGEKKDEKEERRKDYYLSERRYGSFRRTFRIPEDVDVEKIAAAFQRGVLTVTMPRKPSAAAAAKKIAVKAS